MARRTLGTKGKGPVKPGNWGYGYLIEKPPQNLEEFELDPKKPSCKICKYYQENKYCRKKNFFIPIMGYGYAKECDKFSIIHELNKSELAETVRYNKFLKKVKKELLYTGFFNEHPEKDFPYILELNKTKEKNIRRLNKEFKNSITIDDNLDLKIKNILINIILLFVEKDIDLSLIDDILFLGEIKRQYALIGFDQSLAQPFLTPKMINHFNASNSPYYAVLFFEKIKNILNINIDDLFQVTEENLSTRVIKLLNNKIIIPEITSIDECISIKVNYLEKDEGMNYLSINREYNKQKKCYEFSLVYNQKRDEWSGPYMHSFDYLKLYSETENGPLIRKFFDAIDFYELYSSIKDEYEADQNYKKIKKSL